MPEKKQQQDCDVKDAHESLSKLYEKCGIANEIAAMETKEMGLVREQAHRKTFER